MEPPKELRVEELIRRLAESPAAASFEEAYTLLCQTLNAVEDELTEIPCDPENWQTDGRLYPPQPISMRHVAGHANVKRFRNRGHNTFIAGDGAIEIHTIRGVAVFRKAGSDGREVWDI